MLTVEQRLDAADCRADARAPRRSLTLAFEQRQKSRLRAALDDGAEVGLFLARGTVLRDGDRLLAADGQVIVVRAAAETVSTARAAAGERAALTLARAAYHLGNRHVALQLGGGWLRYRHDHVLDALCERLGLRVRVEQAPFEPEAGAYAPGQQHGHGRDHGRD